MQARFATGTVATMSDPEHIDLTAREAPMYKFYSETAAARMREIVADVSTWIWVAFWAVIGSRVNDAI